MLRPLFLVCLLTLSSPAAAQLVDVQPFTALDGTGNDHFGNFALAAGGDSGALVVTSNHTRDAGKRTLVAQRFASTGPAVGGLSPLDGEIYVSNTNVFSDARGGFVALWTRSIGNALMGRLLDQSGSPTTAPFAVAASLALGETAAGLPSGFVVVWYDQNGIRFRVFDTAATPLGSVPFLVPVEWPTLQKLEVAGLSDGGFLIVWQDGDGTYGRRFDASGAAVGAVIAITLDFELWSVAANPVGGFALLGSRLVGTHTLPAGVWARRFDGAGAPLGPSFVVDIQEDNTLVFPEAAYDPAGRLLVAWQATSFLLAPFGRAYDPDGRPLHAPFELSDERMGGLVLAARPDGRFVEGWRQGNYSLRMQVQSLCVPPFHTGCGDGVVSAPCEKCDLGPGNSDTAPNTCRTTCALPRCGDGVVDNFEQCDDGNLVGCDGCDATCNLEPGWQCGDGVISADCEEQCDDGPGNDDVTPNACRTDCRRAHCGDGILDDGEGCDDGNRTSCDGCSDLCVPEPGLVCGDGIAEVLCGEECDDGNSIVGDGCAGSCSLERIPGGGSPLTDCQIEWVVENAANVPLLDKNGAINAVQTCTDGDARCDFDVVPGTCTFHVRVCANNTNLPSCEPGSRLRSWDLRYPSATKAAKRPDLAAVRAAFAVVPGAIIGPDRQDVCSETLTVPVKVKTSAGGSKPGPLVLKAASSLYTGEKDNDRLKLVCVP